MIALLITAHLFGDFPLQNDWMQSKSRNSWVCTAHVAAYSLPFLALAILSAIPWWVFVVIISEHWLQDRFALHLKWTRLYRQTPPDKWPIGPLCMDQAWHISFIGLVGFAAGQ